MKEIPEPRWITLTEAMPPISTLVWGLIETGQRTGGKPYTQVIALLEIPHEDGVQFHWADQDGLQISGVVLAWWPIPSVATSGFSITFP